MTCLHLLFACLLGLASAVDLENAGDLDSDTDEDYEQYTDLPNESETFTDSVASTLRLAHVLYRHGDRSQIQRYANDLYQESDWPQGYGQLSTTGMEQEYFLGQYLNQRYVESDFLTPVYQRNEIYVRSTACDRTLMSAYSVLSALFPPIDEVETWNTDLSWQPIPVHTVPKEEDYLLCTGTLCPVFTAAQEDYLQNNPVINETLRKYENYYVYISDNSGEPNTWDGIKKVLDPIFCQNASGNLVLPDWVTPSILDIIVELRDIYSSNLFPPQYAYLRGGPLVGEMLAHMINRSAHDDTTFPTKLYMYSAHDSTVVSFLTTLGVYNMKQPPYTACVMVELHEVHPDDFSVLILYKNESDSPPYPLKLSSCDIFCPLEKFAQLIQSLIPKDPIAECSLSGQGSGQHLLAILNSLETSFIVAITLGSILVLILLITAICFIKKKFTKVKHEYAPVPIEMN